MTPKRKKDPTTWPRTHQVADLLLLDIRTGVYLPGEEIPSARAMCVSERYGPMAIFTATGVSKLMQDLGVVEAVRGRRARVRPYAQWPEGLYDPAAIVPRAEPEPAEASDVTDATVAASRPDDSLV